MKKIQNKLWNKGWQLNPIVEAFETKGDLSMDQKLIKYDVQGSLAHVKMLFKIGILSKEELKKLEKAFQEILDLEKKTKFNLEMGDEDIHTKIENFITKKYGEVGKKIHTGRSRNDQVLTAIRLFNKEYLQQIEKGANQLIGSFEKYTNEYGDIPMPGYTHMQKAMPSSIRIWAQSFKQSLEDDLMVLKAAYRFNDQSPLGSGAGYGVPINLDKEYTAKLMGFENVQENPLYCQNSKGKIEAVILAASINILQTINKFASDVMQFSTQEFGFFNVADELTSGSSIMPQKKNVDIAELLRSKVHVVLGNYIQIVSMSSNLISGYNRDLQDIKKPLFESLAITLESVKVANVLLQGLTPNNEKLKSAMTDDLYMAQKAFKLVEKGMAFREAYKKVSNEIFNVKGGEKNEN